MVARFGGLIKTAGSALAVGMIIFIVVLLWREREVFATFRPGIAGLAVLALCTLVYAMLGYVLADAWRRVLIWTGEANVCGTVTRLVYAQTQIAKYIPGNVAQFAGRQFIGRQMGWTHAGLLLSTVFELVLLCCTAATLAAITVAVSASGTNEIVDPTLLWSVVAALVFASVVVLRASPAALAKWWPQTAQRMKGLKVHELWLVAVYYVLFFALSGILLVGVAGVVLAEQLAYRHWPILIGLSTVAWTAGTLTPGAPSGIGIRETVLVAGLAFLTTPGSAILIATLLRVVTILGDLLFFLFAGLRTPE